MRYLVTGRTIGTGRMVSPEQFTKVLEKGIILTAEAYNKLRFKKKISDKNMSNGTRTGVAIVEGSSHDEVNRLLMNVPSWSPVNWTVTPL